MKTILARSAAGLLFLGLLGVGTAFPAVNDIRVHLNGKDACLTFDPVTAAYYLACTNTAVTNNAITIYKSVDQGATWQSWASLQRTGIKIVQPRIKVLGSKVYFVFAADPASAHKLYFGTLSTSNPLVRQEYESAVYCTNPDLAVYADKAYLVWGGYTDLVVYPYDVFFAKFNFTTGNFDIIPQQIGGQNLYDPGVFIRPTIDLDTVHAPAGNKLIVAFEDSNAHEIHVTTSLDGGTTFSTHVNITNTASINESNPKVRFRFYIDSDYAVVAFNTGGANNSLDYLASVDLFTTITPFDVKANFPTLSGGDFDFQFVSESYSSPNRSIRFRGAHWQSSQVRLFELELRQHMGIFPPELDTYITPGVTFGSTSDVDATERISYQEPPDANRCAAWNDTRNGGDDVYFNGTATVEKTVTVTEPTSATIWTRGQNATVTWTTTGAITGVNIKLYKGATKVQDLALGTANDGTETFIVANGLANGPDYRVLVEDALNVAVYDYSDYFVVEQKIVTVTLPTSATVWTKGQTGTVNWATTGTITTVNIYLYKSTTKVKDIALGTPNDHTQTWTVASDLVDGTDYKVRVTDGVLTAVYDDSDLFTVQTTVTETISTPTTPSGDNTVPAWAPSIYATGGSASNLGHSVQYRIEWGDGSDSGWLPVGTTSAAKGWKVAGTYNVRAKARCSVDTGVESAWSAALAVAVSASSGFRMILPETIWAAATGGGTWTTEVQVTDVSGSSLVAACFNYGGGLYRGPFALWTGPGVDQSVKYANILSTLQALDPGFVYEGRVGALEFVTQDAAHKIRVAARTFNGNYSKTFPGLEDVAATTADTTRGMVVPNLTSNASYRSSLGLFNPAASSLDIQVTLVDENGATIGSPFTKNLAAYDFQSFNPFVAAGHAYPAYVHDNVCAYVVPTSGTGRAMMYGGSANNTTNDPAAHIAAQAAAGYDNSPSSLQVVPEVIWAVATGGGTWLTEAQVVDLTGGSQVSVYFDYGGGNRTGPFALWTGGAARSSVKLANLLATVDGLDTGPLVYYGRVGTVEFATQDVSHTIHIAVRTLNGNYSKTFPGLNIVDGTTAAVGRDMLVQNLTSNAVYRSSIGFFNPTADSLTVEFRLIKDDGTLIGSAFSRTLVGRDFQSVNPFNAAGVPYPTFTNDNVWLLVHPTGGTGKALGFGATANNVTNDPASHIVVRLD